MEQGRYYSMFSYQFIYILTMLTDRYSKLRHLYNSYTKMGFSGNLEPQYIIPTVLATKAEEGGLAGTAAKRDGIEDLDFHVGDAAFDNSTSYQLNYPIRHGLIDNWDNMERLWQRCIFEYLRCEPEDHYVLLTGGTPYRMIVDNL